MNQDTEIIQNMPEDGEIDLMELFYYLKTKALLIILLFFVGTLGAGAFTHFCITPKYQATAKLYVVSASGKNIVNLEDLSLGSKLSLDYQELLQIRPIYNEIIDELDLDYTYEQLKRMISIQGIGDTRILTLTVTSTVPEEARDIANILADKAVTYLPKLMGITAPNIAEQAITPEMKSSPSMAKNALLGGILAAVAVIGIFIVLFITDDTVKSSEDVEKLIGVMPLTVIPENRDQSQEKTKNRRGRKYRED